MKKGLVYKSTGSWYTVKAEDGNFYECRIKGKFRIEGIKSTNPVAVGDHVVFEVERKGDETIGIINTIKERDNYIIRKSVKLSKQTHIIAANIDIAFLFLGILFKGLIGFRLKRDIAIEDLIKRDYLRSARRNKISWCNQELWLSVTFAIVKHAINQKYLICFL